MKNKILFLILSAFVFTSMPNAETLNFDWGIEFQYENRYSLYISDVKETKDKYQFYYDENIYNYDKKGNFIDKTYIEYDFMCEYRIDGKDTYLCLNQRWLQSNNYELIVELYSNDNELIRSNKTRIENRLYYDYTYENDEYYVLFTWDSQSLYLIDKSSLSLEKYIPKENELEELLGEYAMVYSIISKNENRHYYNYKKGDNYKILMFQEIIEDEYYFGIEVYNSENIIVKDLIFDDQNEVFIAASNQDFYVVRTIDIDDREECRNEEECESYIELSKYNYNVDKIYTKNLSRMISDGTNFNYRNGRKLTDLKLVSDGIILITNYILTPTSLEEEINGRNPVALKYSFTYDIETKTDGNGDIKVENTSKSGEEITYEVTPKKGYVLGVVKVTDSNGNTIEFTSNRFTMPNSDVTIEATFIPEVLSIITNPETKDIAIITLTIALITGLIFTIFNYKKLKYLK